MTATTTTNTSSKPDRTPLGLPCLLPRSTYLPIDVFSAIATTVIVPLLLESDALVVYMAAALFHDVLVTLIDYDETNSSYLKRWTGLNVAINLKYMFLFDCCISFSHFYFPFRLKGFSVLATKNHLLGIRCHSAPRVGGDRLGIPKDDDPEKIVVKVELVRCKASYDDERSE